MQVGKENFHWKIEWVPRLVNTDSTESMIESLHACRKEKSIVINPDFLDDEKLPERQRRRVLSEIFNRNIREKQLGRIISHLSPVLDGRHPHAAFVFGPTGSGKTVTLIHVLSSFPGRRRSVRPGSLVGYCDTVTPSSGCYRLDTMTHHAPPGLVPACFDQISPNLVVMDDSAKRAGCQLATRGPATTARAHRTGAGRDGRTTWAGQKRRGPQAPSR